MLRDLVSGSAEWALWLGAIVAGIAALGKLGHYLFRLVRWGRDLGAKITRLDELASYELQHNGGGSIKDAVAMIPPLKAQVDAHIAASEGLMRQGAADRVRIEDTLSTLTEHQVILDEQQVEQQTTIANLADALSIVARSTPPDD